MNCPKCGNRLDYDAKFCKYCGDKVNNDHSDQFSYNYSYSNKKNPKYNMQASHEDQFIYNYNYAYDKNKFDYDNLENTYTTNGDDIYIKTYIGQNYTSMKNEKFSIFALLCGPLYFFARKMYLYGFIYLAILIGSVYYFSLTIFSAIALGLAILSGIKVKAIYNSFVEKKVETIKQRNLDKSTSELLALCKKRGGVNQNLVIIMMILGFFSLPIFSILFEYIIYNR